MAGKRISSPIRQETVSIRGIVPGEYTVNVNHYLATTGAPVPVSVKVEKVNPALEVVHYATLLLDHTGHERTARASASPTTATWSTSIIAKSR